VKKFWRFSFILNFHQFMGAVKIFWLKPQKQDVPLSFSFQRPDPANIIPTCKNKHSSFWADVSFKTMTL